MFDSKTESRQLKVVDLMNGSLNRRSSKQGSLLAVALRGAAVQNDGTSCSTRGRFQGSGVSNPELACMFRRPSLAAS
jgi:hypothetical protein